MTTRPGRLPIRRHAQAVMWFENQRAVVPVEVRADRAGAKNAAFADISRLTQALVRGKTWKVLNDSVARIAGRFAEAVGHTLTKKGLARSCR